LDFETEPEVLYFLVFIFVNFPMDCIIWYLIIVYYIIPMYCSGCFFYLILLYLPSSACIFQNIYYESNRKIVKIGDTSMSLISLNIFVFAKYNK
jgi:hypothetical protein